MYFCVNCLTGKEALVKKQVETYLDSYVEEKTKVWFPTKEVTEKKLGKERKRVIPLFPSYIFIFWEGEDEEEFPFHEITKFQDVIRFLDYGDGTHALVGKDLKYASWVNKNDGYISQSKVIFKEGQRIHIVEGPLVGFDGNVTKVDRHHKRITVRFDIGEISSEVSFTVDFLQYNAASQT